MSALSSNELMVLGTRDPSTPVELMGKFIDCSPKKLFLADSMYWCVAKANIQ